MFINLSTYFKEKIFTMNRLVLLLGGNIGDRNTVFNSAINEIIVALGAIHTTSSLFETEAWGFETEDLFLNQVIVVNTTKSAKDCLDISQCIEKKLGRLRHKKKYSSRVIDIDILFYNSEIINTPTLEIPHPRIKERNFVLQPLNEIMPDFLHPVLNKKISTLTNECADNCKVHKIVC